MRIQYRQLWTVTVEHAFFGGTCDELEITVPRSTARVLDGARAIARARGGRLHVFLEVDDDEQPTAGARALVGKTVHFGLQPRTSGFGAFTADPYLPRGRKRWWRNAPGAGLVERAGGLVLSTRSFRVEPIDPRRPLEVRVSTPDGTLRDQFTLPVGQDAHTPLLRWGDGEWLVQETVDGAGPTHARLVDDELAASDPWGVLSLTAEAPHLADGRSFTIALDARSDVLRYYVVGDRFDEDELESVDVLDRGAAADDRDPIEFERLDLDPGDASHLTRDALGAREDAPVALFQSTTELPRRIRGPARIELTRGDLVLVSNLPSPGADRPDAQFVVHVHKP